MECHILHNTYSRTLPSLISICQIVKFQILIVTISLQYWDTILATNIWTGSIQDDGVKHIVSLLKKNMSLTLLDLANNGITSGGAQMIANVLIRNTTLTHLNIQENNLEDKAAKAFAALLQVTTSCGLLICKIPKLTRLVPLPLASPLKRIPDTAFS